MTKRPFEGVRDGLVIRPLMSQPKMESEMLHIFHLVAKSTAGGNSCDSFVVIAADEKEARELCAGLAGDEGEKVWVNQNLSYCIAIYTIGVVHRPGIILASFNAGG